MAICYNSGIQRKVDMDIRVRAAVKTLGILGYLAIMVVAIQVMIKYAPVELLQYSVATLVVGGVCILDVYYSIRSIAVARNFR
jgi:hypothetical protein